MAQLELVDRQKDLFLLLRKPSAPAGRSLAIFVHGFLGDHVTTWGRLPEMLRENTLSEPLLASWDFLFLGYSTRQIASYLDIARLIATQWTKASTGRVPFASAYTRFELPEDTNQESNGTSHTEYLHQSLAASTRPWHLGGVGSHSRSTEREAARTHPAAIALRVIPRLHRNPVAGQSEYLPATRRLNLS